MSVLSVQEIEVRMQKGEICIVPKPAFDPDKSGEASVDLRMGRWFRTFRQSRTGLLDVAEERPGGGDDESRLTREYFVPFGEKFVLHAGKFVLGITLEWIGLSQNVSAYVTGKSSWGRQGLIIETAAGVHPALRVASR